MLGNALNRVRALFKGNGVKADSIRILSHTIATHTLNAGTYLELRPVTNERQAGGKVAAGQHVPSRADALRAVDQAMIAAASDPVAKAQIADVLLRRPDHGFGLSHQTVPIDFLKREYHWHDSCGSCGGTGKGTCPRCGGRRVETCIKCSGRGLMPCPACHSTGLMHGQKCTRCYGQRYVPCDGCNRTGMMPCRTCNAQGVTGCQTCGGQGWKTHILSLTAQAVTYFEYDPKSIPKGAADIIETRGMALAAAGKIKIKGRIADDRENVLGANYEAEFPYGEVVFQVGKKEAKAHLFGQDGDITEFPTLLDKMLAPVVDDLARAASDVGSVANAIRRATRFRLIAQAYLGVSRGNIRRTVENLMKIYPFGLGAGMAEKIAMLAETTMTQITKKPRLHGFLFGTVAGVLLLCAYYAFVRNFLLPILPDARLSYAGDIIAMLAGGALCGLGARLNARGAVQHALGHLIKDGRKDRLMPKAGRFGIAGYPLMAALTPAIIEAMLRIGLSAPEWYLVLRGFILPP